MSSSSQESPGAQSYNASNLPLRDQQSGGTANAGASTGAASASEPIPHLDLLLLILMLLCVGRLWLMPLPSSFWVDEMATAFVLQHGADHPSLAVAPQVAESIYYWLPRAAEKLLGFSEVSYRLPSVLVMALALFLIGLLAARLVHPKAAWFVAFACLSLRGFNYQAADARPYGLGTCIAAAGLWFLVRWLDSARWRDALLFVVFAAALWRVHLVFWPFYFLFALYAVVRLVRSDTRAGWLQAGIVFTLLGLSLAPVLVDALALYRQAKEHVIVKPPSLRDIQDALKFGLIIVSVAGAALFGRWFRWTREATPTPRGASLTLVLGWWLCQPLCLLAFSWLTGNSVFVPRYLALSLPGAALVAAVAASPFIPPAYWKRLSAVLGLGVLLFLGQWGKLWPLHHNSDWRAAAHQIEQISAGSEMPVICPSPFIEAKPPVWRPDYPLPGFLYSHLPIYPLRGKTYLFPFENSPEAEEYARTLSKETLSAAERFVIYGGDRNVWFWRDWFARQPELAGWRFRLLGPFGDVEVALFEKPAATH
jgi:hypothetical protein